MIVEYYTYIQVRKLSNKTNYMDLIYSTIYICKENNAKHINVDAIIYISIKNNIH